MKKEYEYVRASVQRQSIGSSQRLFFATPREMFCTVREIERRELFAVTSHFLISRSVFSREKKDYLHFGSFGFFHGCEIVACFSFSFILADRQIGKTVASALSPGLLVLSR